MRRHRENGRKREAAITAGPGAGKEKKPPQSLQGGRGDFD